ncbi:hypothetical protein BAU15_01505 [Enterococcus sp. JM4C]|uniref:DUF4767 domain-containing protein n=1 Tax=Candidatus Enterococcus huntleyi TaxID=1857217 RepID=UPI00137ADD9A|nr:DUF4767 domain-containing protein [Enterococcus sp. JM4C]KAF1299349.1 hypothetical protein BAU15_01505 [Enterococcus sp. JM4C]
MKRRAIILLAMSSFLLVGCSSKEKDTQESSTAESKQAVTTESSEKEVATSSDRSEDTSASSETPKVEVEESLWNQEKAKALNEFVVNWGKTMKQTYREYTPDSNVDLYGLTLPRTILTNKDGWRAALDEVPTDLVWSYDGEQAGVNLVAVFSDADTQPYLEKHVYFFTIQAGTPKVYVTTQNQGNEHNYLYFRETENNELKTGFAEIVTGAKNFAEVKKTSENQTQVYLGTIDYKDLDTSDFIQGKARWMGCSIEDDGEIINFIPAMSATVQNLQLFISGNGNEEYYNDFLEAAKEVSLHTGGKPVSIWSRGGDGEMLITAKDGLITYGE